MAENVLQTRIVLRYDTYDNWNKSDIILKKGEAAVCAFPGRVIDNMSNSRPEYTPPSIGIKIGNGFDYFRFLPWVQAVAADVFEWAKAETRPTYTAQDIQGLQSFVENLIHGDVEVNIAPRIYQITRGTGDNIDKYYLRYKESNDDSPWVLDTSESIDLTYLTKILNWLGQSNVDNYANLITRTAEQIRYFISTLNPIQQDQEVQHQFVTSVQETNGIINVSRAQPSFDDISGTLAPSKGGTGLNSLTEDAVLVGNGQNAVKLIPIAESIESNNYLVPNYLIKAYVDNATAGLTGAMHFIGESSVPIVNNSSTDPNIRAGDGSLYVVQPGDVILYERKEFVWDGSSWHLLGDEGSYAIKGSIKDVDIDADAEIQQSKIQGLSETFDTKVDKIEGKTLTSNDFSDELLEKLDNIEPGAQRNVIEHIMLNDVELRPTTVDQLDNVIKITVNEFDEASREKLQNIEANAQVNKIEKIIFDEEEIKPDDNKTITITSNPHTEHENKIEQIFINNVEWVPNENKQVKITIDPAALQLEVLVGAVVPNGSSTTSVPINNNKELELSRIAMTGDIQDLLQTPETYVTLYCGSSTAVI